MKTESEHIYTDVLVIGGGGAGFRAAIAAREKGVRVLLLSKGPLARCGATPMAGADFTLDGKSMHALGRDGDPNDSMEVVANKFESSGRYNLAVIENGKYLGFISRARVFTNYRKQIKDVSHI